MYKETFGEKLKKARVNAGFTQKEVEQETGIKQTLLSRYENGTLEPSIEILGTLIDFYQDDANYILGTRGNNKQNRHFLPPILPYKQFLFRSR